MTIVAKELKQAIAVRSAEAFKSLVGSDVFHHGKSVLKYYKSPARTPIMDIIERE